MTITDTYHIYTDASFSKTEGLAVIGFAIFKTIQEHNSILLADKELQLLTIPELNNIRAELRAVIDALGRCPSGQSVVVYTDCQNIVGLPSRRQNLEHNGYLSQNTHQPLANADLYKEFFVHFDRLKLKLIWIKGHSPSKGRDHVQTNFSHLDRAVRKQLREAAG